MTSATFGELLRELRLAKGLTLRAYCQQNGEDPGYISRIERGLAAAPRDNTVLGRLAKSVGIKEDTAEWRTFHDLADISAGRIPRRVMEEEELVKHLPLFFRTISGERFPEEKLEELIDYIRAINTPPAQTKEETGPETPKE